MRRLDRTALIALRTRFHGRRTERAVIAFSFSGEMGALWLALGLAGVAFDRERRAGWLRTIALVPLTLPVNYLIKIAVRRERPRLRRLPPLGHVPGSDSFPSGHASSSFAVAWSAPRARPEFLTLAILMSLSRPYLGLHYPSDVLAGAVIGSAIGIGVSKR